MEDQKKRIGKFESMTGASPCIIVPHKGAPRALLTADRFPSQQTRRMFHGVVCIRGSESRFEPIGGD